MAWPACPLLHLRSPPVEVRHKPQGTAYVAVLDTTSWVRQYATTVSIKPALGCISRTSSATNNRTAILGPQLSSISRDKGPVLWGEGCAVGGVKRGVRGTAMCARALICVPQALPQPLKYT